MVYMIIKSFSLTLVILITAAATQAADLVQTANGTVEGRGVQPSGVRIFRGIPFAQPPTGNLRWREPQPVENWKGVKKATDFGPRCMQARIFDDMVFRSNGVSEDCLYLNVWTPAKSNRERLPVLVYFYGGGFVSGDGSEPRYDGESMASKGIVVVTVNYRLGVFGFLAHPELVKESPHHASGNYGFLDQNAGLQWVQKNITNFGGDPKRVTIAGESAGSMSVSAHLASPLSKNLIAGAIGESGALTGALSAAPRAKAEEQGKKFADLFTTPGSIANLRTFPAQQLLYVASEGGWTSVGRFSPTIDGYFLTEDPLTIYQTGKQARVPLLVGWNSEELGGNVLFGDKEQTVENYKIILAKLYPTRADEALKLYPATTTDEVIQAATDLASDRMMGHSTWKWSDLHAKGARVYRYFYTRPRPPMRTQKTPPARGASHSAEIEYAMGNLDLMKDVYPWTPDDYKVSNVMQSYFANFIKKGNPNGVGLPKWPALATGRFMRIDVEPRAETDTKRARYVFLDQLPR
ncbi:MAG TPA: carboxylesterase/lipase family protein [Pyrinomonadaceae bacterium]|nr:carboxylesterase/lipase family protein [Pyrinomonadaceae bacterium]